MLGRQSDLQTGLPLQSLTTGARQFHEPLRLLAVIEADTERLSQIISRHVVLQNFFENEWIYTRLLSSHDGRVFAVSARRNLEGDFLTDIMMIDTAYIHIPALPFVAFLIIALRSRWFGETSHEPRGQTHSNGTTAFPRRKRSSRTRFCHSSDLVRGRHGSSGDEVRLDRIGKRADGRVNLHITRFGERKMLTAERF